MTRADPLLDDFMTRPWFAQQVRARAYGMPLLGAVRRGDWIHVMAGPFSVAAIRAYGDRVTWLRAGVN